MVASSESGTIALPVLRERAAPTAAAKQATPKPPSPPCYTISRTNLLRLVLVATLMTAAGVCSAVAFVTLRNAEREVGKQTYESIAASALTGARAITMRKVQGSEVMATLLSYTLPDADMWPLISVNGYIPIADKVASLSSSTTQSLMVFLDPNQTEVYEQHMQQEYIDQGRPETAGVSDFGFGIYRNDNDSPYEDGRVHDSSGETVWGGTLGLLTPLTFHNRPGSTSLLYNVYSEYNRGFQLDSMVACANANTGDTVSPSCAVITDMLVLQIRPGPAGLLFQPVYPANDPNQLVGFATTSIHWQEVLTSVVPDYVDGLTCVVTTDTSAYTYSIQDGEPQLVGPGDLHDDDYGPYNRSLVLNDFIETGANTSAVYTLTVYPTEVMFNAFSTNSPVRVSVGFFGVIALCTVLFFFYDFLMRHEAQQRKVILEMKRRFVRFISHEIRTPLNAVSMGLELLESEFIETRDKDEGEDKLTEDDVEFLHNVTVDTKENVNVAVSILNDLLDYDKLETGIMKLELVAVDIWALVVKTANQFNIPAVNRKIDLKINVKKPTCQAGTIDVESGTERELNVVGDDVKLGQVLRNVISNAMKFVSTNNGCIEVSACHVPNGLSFTKPLGRENEGARLRAGAVQISVKDNGVGLSKEQLALLFTEGVQFDANKLQHGGGSGLGLSIARGIVEQHGGTILAESEGHGHGTTFIIKIRLYEFIGDEIKQQGDKESIDATSATALTEASSRLRNPSPPKRILVAEDTTSSRRMLIRLLERAGHTCVEAVNGHDAVEAVKIDLAKTENNLGHLPIDIILMDFEMPQIRGPEATRRIRQLGFDGTILGVTGNVLSDDIEFFRDHGADDVLPKPISLASLRVCWEEKGRKRQLASEKEELRS